MWKIFFTYNDRSRRTVQGKGTITPEAGSVAGGNVAGQDAWGRRVRNAKHNSK